MPRPSATLLALLLAPLLNPLLPALLPSPAAAADPTTPLAPRRGDQPDPPPQPLPWRSSDRLGSDPAPTLTTPTTPTPDPTPPTPTQPPSAQPAPASPPTSPSPAPSPAPGTSQLGPDHRATLPPPPPTPPWRRTVDLGVFGSDGNSQNLSVRGGLSASRDTPRFNTAANTDYYYATSGSRRTASRGNAQLRNDWKYSPDSRWSLFALGRAEYDEFQDWTWRLSAFAGPGYAILRDSRQLLKGRLGAGVSREIGGPGDGWTPEGLLAAEYRRTLTPRANLTASSELFPALDDPGEFRATNRVGLDVRLDTDGRLTLRMGIENRYDSLTTGRARRSDVDYFAVFSWGF